MFFRSNILLRFGLGLGIVILAIIISGIFSKRTISQIQEKYIVTSTGLENTVSLLIDFRDQVHTSSDFINEWFLTDRSQDSPILTSINTLRQIRVPELHQQILDVADQWSQRDRERLVNNYSFIIDSIFPLQDSLIQLFLPSYYLTQEIDSVSLYQNMIGAYYKKAYDETQYLISKFERNLSQERNILLLSFKSSGKRLLIIQFTIAVIAILIAIVLIRYLLQSIKSFKRIITELGKGELPEHILIEGSDEIGQMAKSLNTFIANLRSMSDFSQEIGKGNYDTEFQPLGDNDILGNSLISMREDLKNAAVEDQKRKEEDERRNWSTQGIARFSEILREYSNQFDELIFQVTSNLVKYLDANVGGLFLIRKGKSEEYIELAASYAYNRKKFIKKKIEIGEGLVGRCVQEGETIYMTELPDDYIKIKSGLGEDKPKSLLIVPLRLNEEILGVMEIASLHEVQSHQIEFVERIGNSIASSISSLSATKQEKGHGTFESLIAGDLPDDEKAIKEELTKIGFLRDQVLRKEQELKDHLESLLKPEKNSI